MAIAFTKLDNSALPGHTEIPYCMTITSPVRKSELAKKCEGRVVRCVLETGTKEFSAGELNSVAKFLEHDSSIVLAVGSPWDFYCQLKEFRVGLGSGRLAKSNTESIVSACPNAKHEFGNRSLIGNLNTLSYVAENATR